MVKVVGMPDLHPGKGHPIGAAFISKKYLYPYLVSNDIGCGMGLWQTDLNSKKLKLERWVNRLENLESCWNGDLKQYLEENSIVSTKFDSSLGTIGGGNHFAELQVVHEIKDKDIFSNMSIEKDKLFLLVHSGSRGLGESILREHIERFKADGLPENTSEAEEYLTKHNFAINWAKTNRKLISYRFLSAIGSEGKFITDICHNSVSSIDYQGCSCWLHRKGAAPSNEGPVVIPGSRGSYSYLVMPKGEQRENAFSLAHGAGRKWGRGSTKAKLESKFLPEDLKKTDLGSYVICEDKNLLYEEAPQAYKNIDRVVQDLIDAELVEIIAVLKPLITYKTRNKR